MTADDRKLKDPDDPIEAAQGALRKRIPPSEAVRARARADEQDAVRRREQR